jgi:hypothetical protein
MQEEKYAYVTAKEARQLLGSSQRQLDRFVGEGLLEVIDHQKGRPRKFSRASIDAFNAKHGHYPVDPLELINQQLAGQKQVNGELLLQIAALREKIAELERLMQRLCADLEGKIRALAGQRARNSARGSPAERRGLPATTIRLAHFAQNHRVEPSSLRVLAEKDPTLATIIERPLAQVYKREWWLTRKQQAEVIAIWQVQGVKYTPCADCPHAESIEEAS